MRISKKAHSRAVCDRSLLRPCAVRVLTGRSGFCCLTVLGGKSTLILTVLDTNKDFMVHD